MDQLALIENIIIDRENKRKKRICMDILDEINNKQFGKAPRKKISAISNPNPSSSIQDTFSPANNQINYNESSRLKKEISSYQHLKIGKVQQFNLFQSPPDSFKDSNSMSGNVNIPRLSKFQSLGVIISEESSEESKKIVNMAVSKRHPQNTNKPSYKQMQQLKQKLKNESQKSIAQQSTIKELKQKIEENNLKINELKQQLNRSDQRYHEERSRLLNEQSQFCNKQISRLNRLHEEQIKRREELMKWQSKKREDLLKLQIQSLNTTIIKYKTLLETESELSTQKQELSLKHEKQHNENKTDKQRVGNLQRQLEQRAHILQQRMQQFYKQKRQADKKYLALQKQVDEQKLKNKREHVKISQQIRQRLEERQKQLDKKDRVLNQKLRTLEYESKQLSIRKQLFEKEKQERAKLNDRIVLQNKKKSSQIGSQKQKISCLQRQLLEKIAIVELRAQNRTFAEQIINKTPKYEEKCKEISQQKVISAQKTPEYKNQKKQQQKQNKIDPNTKIDFLKYLQNLQKNRQNKSIKPIYKLHQFYK